MRRYRKAERLRKILLAIQARIMPNGRIRSELFYFGAHTGRWAGAGGVNLQGLNKLPFEGIDLRSVFVAAPGKKFLICDLSQIEARVLAWLAGDEPSLEAMRRGISIYEAEAINSGMWTPGSDDRPLKKVDPSLYALMKARILGLGFGMGAKRFTEMLAAEPYLITMSEEDAQKQVNSFRKTHPVIRSYWYELENLVFNDAKHFGATAWELNSGRRIFYHDLEIYKDDEGRDSLKAVLQHGTKAKRVWGGVFCENVTQGTARDLLGEIILNVEDCGIPVVLHSHDEIVLEVDQKANAADILELIKIPPDWAADLPIDAEMEESPFYKK
jgi:DNA polymerase I-like protein with 3'-5' exonuclease and polymerase domains